jgi:hypothetical protein
VYPSSCRTTAQRVRASAGSTYMASLGFIHLGA